MKVELRVKGRVQGVGYRYFTLREAEKLRVSGFVRNLPDGCVQVVVQGEETAVNTLIQALRAGPPSADVEAVEVTIETQATAPPGFEIR